MDNHLIGLPALVVIFLVIVALIFLRPLRRLAVLLIRLAIFVAGVAVAVGGIAMILNNETIFEKPGAGQRVTRFLTMNSAAASASGSGAVTCDMGDKPKPAPSASETPAAAAAPTPLPKKHAPKEQAAKGPEVIRTAQPITTPAPLEDIYPELIRRSFPGISRQKLFQLSQATINSLGGWKIVKADPGRYTIDCIYTTRFIRWEDDVRVTIQPSGEIDVCSRSGTARPNPTSALAIFPGDLGANIAHIKEFYEALEPKMDQVYKEEQDKENAKKPH
ncbi:MAG TPA: DUF1499 domain-containing protein [Candidatus Acidoferrales bacterium]|nr:DUF1499 domain-containing protein [Candidatus Acidoferrales bacterium]